MCIIDDLIVIFNWRDSCMYSERTTIAVMNLPENPPAQLLHIFKTTHGLTHRNYI